MKHISIFFTLSLLVVFTVCSFILLNIQIQNYTVLQESQDYNFKINTPISYVTNKIHSFDSKDSIITTNNILKLSDDTSDTYLYERDGYLMELCVVRGFEPDYKDGQKLLECSNFSVNLDEDKVYCSVNNVDFVVRIRSGEAL
jgi:hypothetical protein